MKVCVQNIEHNKEMSARKVFERYTLVIGLVSSVTNGIASALRNERRSNTRNTGKGFSDIQIYWQQKGSRPHI